jgi:cytochrome P450
VSNGTETTTAAIGFTLYRLAGDPVLQSRLRENPGQISGLVEEILRLFPPVPTVRRTTTEPVTVAGVDLPAGSLVFLCLGAANRADGGVHPNDAPVWHLLALAVTRHRAELC